MSHYTVAVITRNKPTEEDIYEALAPFDENMEMDQYIYQTKEEIIKDARTRLNKIKENEYREYLEDPDSCKEKYNKGFIDYLENEFINEYEMSDEELHKQKISYYDDDQIDEDGNILSTYNPKSKWDWFEIGGRWSGEITLKSGENVDIAKIKDIEFGNNLDYEKIKKERPEIVKDYEDLISGKSNSFYKLEYLKEKYPDINSYIDEMYKFATFAILDADGNWNEPGEMGWFGCSSASGEDEANWNKNYYDILMKNAKEDYYLTVVDCHI